ncbi:MAG TPA: NRDE family protein [Streptosporangiaceae bacterium]|nr:NRDE family protein [Streptosporangiaceae bacterium]
MCTAVLSVEPGLPVLLAGVRDEFTSRSWEPPAPHWPQYPGLVGGRDLLAGGTWLAVSPQDRRAACVLNGLGQFAPSRSRQSRGVLPLLAAAGESLDRTALPSLDPFHLVTVRPGYALVQSWNGRQLDERELKPGLHFVVNSGLASDLVPADQSQAPAQAPAAAPNGRAHELARIGYFLRKFQAARRPDPRPGQPARAAWDAWFGLVNGDGLDRHDQRALIVRRELADGRTWGTTSISLVALSPAGLRYDFARQPGDPAAWYSVI